MILNTFRMSMGIYKQNSFHDRSLDIIFILWIEIHSIQCESFQCQNNIKQWKAALKLMPKASSDESPGASGPILASAHLISVIGYKI